MINTEQQQANHWMMRLQTVNKKYRYQYSGILSNSADDPGNNDD